MQTDSTITQTASLFGVEPYLQRLQSKLEDVNARIARLAMALGMSLQRQSEIEQLIQACVAAGDNPHLVDPRANRATTHTGPERRDGSYGGQERRGGRQTSYNGPERRKNAMFVELRGMVVLRCEMQRHYAEQIGPSVTMHLLEQAEAALLRHGFAPGADGEYLTNRRGEG